MTEHNWRDMTVGQLRLELANYDADMPVVTFEWDEYGDVTETYPPVRSVGTSDDGKSVVIW